MRWSHNLAYAVGLITTDGGLSKDDRHISFTSKDLEQITNLAKALRVDNKIGTKIGGYSTTKKYFVLQFGNKKLYSELISIGLFPNKSKHLGSLIIPSKYFADFLRGHLDGDGHTYSYWDKRWKSSFLLYTGFCSASERHLIWLRDTIRSLYLISGKIKFTERSLYHLIYAKGASLVLLSKLYYKPNILYLSRKKDKIDRSLGIIHKQAGMLKLVDRHA